MEKKIIKIEELKLGYIKLTAEMIVTINNLQTGGTDHFSEPPADDQFDNCNLNDRLNELTELTDRLISIHYHEEMLNEHDCMHLLGNINYLKKILSDFAAPQPEKQIFNN